MQRLTLKTAAAAAAALALAACSDTPIQPASSTLQPSPARAAAASGEDALAPGEVLVKMKDGESLDDVLRSNGASKKGDGYKGKFAIARTNNGNERALAARLAADPRVEYAEPNYIRQVDQRKGKPGGTTPPPPATYTQPTGAARLWAFSNPGSLNMQYTSGGTGFLGATNASTTDADIDDVSSIAGLAISGGGGTPVLIGSIDTGVDYSHSEFAGRLIRGCDWYSMAAAGDASSTCSDFSSDDTPDEGHGTHTSGTMAGTNVGVAGRAGVAGNVKVLVQRVCGEVGCYTSSIVNAILAATDYTENGQHLVAMNLSLGGGTESTGEKNAIAAATQQGVLVIASAGNSGTSRVACPACDPNAISVASTTWSDALASYSQYGTGLDIAAPGGLCYSNTTEEGCIFSAIVSGYTLGATYTEFGNANAYAYMNGTSMAAPQVTGAAAVVAYKTGLRGANLRNRLLTTADDKGTAGYDTRFGSGRLNVYRAVTGSTTSGF